MLSMILHQMRFTQASACCLVETDKFAFIFFFAKDFSIHISALEQMYLIASDIALSRAPATIRKVFFVPEGSRVTADAFAR